MNNWPEVTADDFDVAEPLVPTSPKDLFFEMKDPQGRVGLIMNDVGEQVGTGTTPGWVVWDRKTNRIFGENGDWIYDSREAAQRLANYLNYAAAPRRVHC